MSTPEPPTGPVDPERVLDDLRPVMERAGEQLREVAAGALGTDDALLLLAPQGRLLRHVWVVEGRSLADDPRCLTREVLRPVWTLRDARHRLYRATGAPFLSAGVSLREGRTDWWVDLDLRPPSVIPGWDEIHPYALLNDVLLFPRPAALVAPWVQVELAGEGLWDLEVGEPAADTEGEPLADPVDPDEAAEEVAGQPPVSEAVLGPDGAPEHLHRPPGLHRELPGPD